MSTEAHATNAPPAVVMLSGRKVLLCCAAIAAMILVIGHSLEMPVWLLAAEVLATILGLFLFGSFKYQIHKNPFTYGMLLIILATFVRLRTSEWRIEIARGGVWLWVQHHLLSFSGLDEMFHADTMLFILGLTFFVSVMAQTRLLEEVTLFLLRVFNGATLPTVISVTAVVAFASGIFSGVAMIGLTIRTLLIVLLLAAAPTSAIRYAVMVCTTVTTICGIWLAYGEPPNLIMKANLHPYLNDMFFLRYCGPAAVASYLVIAWHLRRKLGNPKINLEEMDVIDANAGVVRFLQASRHGEVLSSIELIQDHAGQLAGKSDRLLERLRGGESLGLALARESVPEAMRKKLLGHFVSEELADSLDRHYVLDAAGDVEGALDAEQSVDTVLAALSLVRNRAQKFGAFSLIPFIGLLILHAFYQNVPLFLASFAGFFAALLGIGHLHRMRALAMREAINEYAEYYFLFPLFLSITLLTNAGFFNKIQDLIHHGIAVLGNAHVATAQFYGCTFLSSILDNNVVADFASRGLYGLNLGVLHLFALAQIAGYALGGCWTHIGSAQSVVAFAFIQREVDEHFTPVQWIKEMTPVILGVLFVLTVLIYIESAILAWVR